MATFVEKTEIKIDGKSYNIDEKNYNNNDYIFSEIRLTQELLKPNELRFVIEQESAMELKSDILSSSEKLLGKTVDFFISTKSDSASGKVFNDVLEFSGIIFHVNTLRKNIGAGSVIEVVAYSPDYLLYDNPHCVSYEKMNLKNIVTETLSPYDFAVKNEPDTEDEIPYTVQYNESNYAFLNRLAVRYGQWFFHNGKELVFGKIEKSKPLDLQLEYDVIQYQYFMNMEHVNFTHAHHNYLEYGNTQHNALSFTGENMHNLTDLAYKQSKEHYKKETFEHLKGSTAEENPFDETELSAELQGLGRKSQMMTCMANSNRADLRIGKIIQIKEKSEVDNTKIASSHHDELLISKIIHYSNSNGFYENEFMAIPNNCDYPPYNYADTHPKCETQRAVVKENNDPEKLGRIRVQFLWQLEQNSNVLTPWIRIAQPHGGDNKGFYFIPEVDEEVMVGFENGNAEKPYVIGTLYHGQQHPGSNWYTDSNDIKAIRTRNGHTIEIHDEGSDGFIRIYDNEKENYILTFSTDEKLIKLESTGNIELYAGNDIIMKAENDITMDAGNDIKREAKKDVSEKAGSNITIDADEDITIMAGNDMSTTVGNNDTLKVSANQIINIDGAKDETIAEKFQLTADTIRQEGKNDMLIYSKNHEQKADSSMKLDGGSGLDLYASSIKINN